MSAQRTGPLTVTILAITALCSHVPAVAGIDAVATLTTYQGSVSALGGVRVNGTRFSTDGALFVIDGLQGSELDLEVGKVVTVVGAVNEDGSIGTALMISYDSLIDGPVDAIDSANGRITVLGQPVIVLPDTHIKLDGSPATLDSLLTGRQVEVSGYPRADGGIVATYIGDSRSPRASSVTGKVTNSDANTMMLEINGLEVDYHRAGRIDVVGGIADVGQRLEISGTLDPVTGRLVAEQIATETGGIDAGGMGRQISGIDAGGIIDEVDGIDAGGIIDEVDGIDAGGIIDEVDGIDAGGIIDEVDGIDAGGIIDEVDGIDAGGIIDEVDGIDAGGIIDEVDGIDAGGMGWRIGGIDAGGVTGIDAGGMAANIEGYVESRPDSRSLRVNGTDVRIDSGAVFVNGQPEDLGLDQKVEIRGAMNTEGLLVAQSIEFERGAEEQRTGYIDALHGGELTVAGTTARLTSETAFSDQRESAVREFWADSLYVGDAVVLHGYASKDGFVITRLDRHSMPVSRGEHLATDPSATGAADD